MRARRSAAAAILAAVPLALTPAAAWAKPVSGLVQASSGDPTASCTAGAQSGVNYPNTEVEPYVAVNPWNPHQVIGVFQQDRWSNGGAHAGGVVWSRDGVHYSEGLLPFGLCGAPGGTDYERVSDLWVSYGPDGTAYASGLEFDAGASARNGVGAATSFDGGRTWKFAQPVIADDNPAVGDDKNSVTADPRRPGTAYQVWDRLDQPLDANGNATSFDGSAYISITHDYGRTWSKPRVLVDTSVIPNTQTIGNIVVADDRTGRLYDFFDQITYDDPNGDAAVDAHYAVTSSTDGGRTWSAPTRILDDTSIGDVDPNAPNDPSKVLRTGSGLPNVAIDPVTGELYLATEGTVFTGGTTDQVELVHSTDQGRTWSAPTRISHGPQAPSFTPSIAVDPTGTVSVTYYDVRDLQPGDTTTLPASTWLYSFPRGRQQDAVERRIAPDFDWLLAPSAGGHFLGDYEGLASAGLDDVRPFFATTLNPPQTNDFTGAFETSWGSPFALGQQSPATVSPRPGTGPASPASGVAAHVKQRMTAH